MLFSNRSLVAALASVLFAAGCAANTGSSSVADSDLTATQIGGISGAFTTDSGAIKGLVLAPTGDTFVADIDTGARCITTPCPSTEHVVGTFTSTSTTITLVSDTASDLVQDKLGTYNYKLVDGILSLSRGELATAEEPSLSKAYSYCSIASDCQLQAIEHARCVGEWTCSAANTCAFACN